VSRQTLLKSFTWVNAKSMLSSFVNFKLLDFG
jgi:hypothetical protein